MAGMLPLLDHFQMNWVLGALGESIFRGDSDPNLPTIHRPYWRATLCMRGGYETATERKTAHPGAMCHSHPGDRAACTTSLGVRGVRGVRGVDVTEAVSTPHLGHVFHAIFTGISHAHTIHPSGNNGPHPSHSRRRESVVASSSPLLLGDSCACLSAGEWGAGGAGGAAAR